MGWWQPFAWAMGGAYTLALANVGFTWFATAPDHNEWGDSLLGGTPFAMVAGAVLGGIIATIRLVVLRRRAARQQKRNYF